MGHSGLFEDLACSLSTQLNERCMLSFMVMDGPINARTELSISEDGVAFKIEFKQQKFIRKYFLLRSEILEKQIRVLFIWMMDRKSRFIENIQK